LSSYDSNTQANPDVVVIGGGIAGMAASIHLARAGLQVTCIEANEVKSEPVGESLDWSAPDLLRELGLPMERLLGEGIATYKRHIILKLRNGTEHEYIPGEWLSKPPYNVELDTLHVDRGRLNAAVRAIMLESGVRVVTARINAIEAEGRRVRRLHTAEGRPIEARWYIDASGSKSCLLPRHFRLPFVEYGPHKVAIWNYFKAESYVPGTTLHAFSPQGGYMEWIWKIPIRSDVVGVGYVAPGESIREQRRAGESVQAIYDRQRESFAGLRELGEQEWEGAARTTSFRCKVCSNLAGPNWIVIGEAATMVDPMTSNGVTAALRQAGESARLIIAHRNRARISALAARVYSWRVTSVARFFNCGIERIVYEWPVRARIGIVRAGDVYTIPAWVMNVVYSRLRPKGLIKTALLASILVLLRAGFNLLSWYCRNTTSSDTVGAT
jgi:flavin-dependent dehydrogenase